MTVIPLPRLFFFWRRAITIWWPWRKEPRVYAPADRLADPIQRESIERHEAMHIPQWLELGCLGFPLKYVTRRGRLELEIPGFVESVRVQVERGYRPSVATYAQLIKRGYWLWGISPKEIRDRLLAAYEAKYGYDTSVIPPTTIPTPRS